MLKYVNLVNLVKSFSTRVYLQKLASIQPRTGLSKLEVIQFIDFIYSSASLAASVQLAVHRALALSGHGRNDPELRPECLDTKSSISRPPP